MSTYGTQANKQANQTYGSQSQKANTNAEQDISKFNENQANLAAGKQVGANPYLNPQYLAAVAKLRSGSLNQATNAGTRDLRTLNARTGGMNSTATTGAIGDLALKKAQLGNTLGAEQAMSDWTKNIGYQQQLAQAPLAAASEEGRLFGTATQGQDSALRNLADLQMASYGPYMAAIQAAGGGIAGGLSRFAPKAGG